MGAILSQVSIIDIEGTHPQIPTQIDADIGFAIPIANTLEILGDTSAAGTSPVHTEGSGNTITTFVQTSQAIAATDATKIGLSAFDSADFTVDANGFVTLASGAATGSFNVDAATAPGTDPVVPTVGGLITVTGAQVASGTVGANVIRTDSLAANTYTIEIQRSTTSAASNLNVNGVSHFDSSSFAVDGNGFVTLSTTGAGKTITGDSGGALSPVANNWNILGSGSITTAGAGSTITTQLTGLTDHAVLVGAGTTTITKLAVGATGNVLAGVTGADPAFTTTLTGLTGDNHFIFTTAVSGQTRWVDVKNTSNTASSSALVQTQVAGSSAGDAYYVAGITGGQEWSWGVDNSASDTFVISNTATLGTANVMSVATSGEINYPLQPAFMAFLPSTEADVTGDGTVFQIGSVTALTEVFDQNSDFNTNGTFTAPVTGRYMLIANCLAQQGTAVHTVTLRITTSNATYSFLNNSVMVVGNNGLSCSVLCDMDAADTATYSLISGGSTKTIDAFGGASDRRTNFSGYLAC